MHPTRRGSRSRLSPCDDGPRKKELQTRGDWSHIVGPQRIEIDGNPYGVAPGDFDGDGPVDFAVASVRSINWWQSCFQRSQVLNSFCWDVDFPKNPKRFHEGATDPSFGVSRSSVITSSAERDGCVLPSRHRCFALGCCSLTHPFLSLESSATPRIGCPSPSGCSGVARGPLLTRR